MRDLNYKKKRVSDRTNALISYKRNFYVLNYLEDVLVQPDY